MESSQLTEKKARARYLAPDGDFFFRPEWIAAEPVRGGGSVPGERVVVVYGEGRSALAEELVAAHGGRGTRIAMGTESVGPKDGNWRVNVRDPEAWREPLASGADVLYFLPPQVDIDEVMIDAGDMTAALATGTLALFRLLKSLERHGHLRSPLVLKTVTEHHHALGGSQSIEPLAAPVAGLALSVAKELQTLRVAALDLDPTDPPPVAHLLAEPATSEGVEVVLRGERRFLRRLRPAPLAPVAQPPFRDGGVYLILGGAGGIGLAFARHLAERVQARMVLVGRSEPGESQRRAFAEIEALGGRVLYLRADATDPQAMAAVVARAKQEFGHVHGAVHSALVLADRAFVRMDEEAFLRALAPKVAGSVALAQALAQESLDFFLFFSSAQSFTCSPGQSNYAAACCFKDAFARALSRQLPGIVRVINWGFWGSVGVVATPEYRERLAAQKIYSIEPEEGMEAVERILAGGEEQVMVFKADRSVLAAIGVDFEAERETGEISTEVFERHQGAFHELEELGRRGLLRAWRRAGAPQDDRPVDRRGLRERLGVVPEYHRLFEACLEILGRASWLELEGEWVRFTGPQVGDELEELRRAWAARYAELAGFGPLLWAANDAVVEVLAGRRQATEVLFPGGSQHLVETIYRGTLFSDHHNRLAAEALAESAREMMPGRSMPLRVLELGAGTGSVSAFALDALAALDPQPEYLYSDLSPAFGPRFEEGLGRDFSFARFQVLDVERPFGPQGIAEGSVDLILASNVLHATRDLQTTLGHVAEALTLGGRVVLNEATRAQDFFTLTFGLTPGWWRFADPERRLPGSPLARPETWKELLERHGFGDIQGQGYLAPEETERAQTVFTGVRQGTPVPAAVRAPARAATARAETPPAQVMTSLATPRKVEGRGQEQALLDHLVQVFAGELKLPAGRLRPESTFHELGVDSLVAMSLTRRLEEDLGSLPSSLLFEHTSMDRLARHLLEEHREGCVRVLDGGAVAESVLPPQPAPPVTPQPAPPTTLPLDSQEVSTEKQVNNGAVAIVGLSGRYPGAPDLDTFWDLLRSGRSGVGEIPADRWDWRRDFDPKRGTTGKAYTRWGGFLDDVDRFDPLFFQIAPADARVIDPQERLVLEATHGALEDAGVLQQDLDAVDRKVGVFIGVMNHHYQWLAAQASARGPMNFGTSAAWSIANRVSYALDLQGPNLAVDTACSSSLVAVHLACESLRRGESALALAGGVNLILSASHYVRLCQAGMLAADERCKSFGAGADGFVDAEGVGAVVLKPLHRALEDGDRIYGTILGTSMNAGGRTMGFTVPSVDAQHRLVEEALESAGVSSDTISYVEAHGTGTEVGDPIEVAGLARAFGSVPRRQPCALGSVKSNMGHAESAAGMAGLAKILLQMEAGALVPTLHSEEPNPSIDFERSPFRLQHGLGPWQRHTVESDGQLQQVPRRAGISSFGAGGTNVHIVLEEPPVTAPAKPTGESQLLILSAKDAQALERRIHDLANFLRRRCLEVGDERGPESAIEGSDTPEVQWSLRSRVAELLEMQVDEVDEDLSWDDVGLDVLAFTQLAQHVLEHHGVRLSPTEVHACGGLRALVSRVAGDGWEPSRKQGIFELPVPTLEEVAYTLQTGREAMAHRAALVVDSVETAVRKLEGFSIPGPGEGCFHGVLSRGATSDSSWRGIERQLIEGAERLQGLGWLARIWCSGAEINWRELYGEQDLRRVRLPAYPFARESYWIDVPESSESESAPAPTPEPAPKAPPIPAPVVPASTMPLAERVEAFVRSLLSQVIEIPPERIEVEADFSEYGVDSISAMQLGNEMNDAVGEVCDYSTFFEHPTVRELTDHLVTHHAEAFEALAAPTEASAPKTPEPLPAPPATTAPAAGTSRLAQIVADTLGTDAETLDPEAELDTLGLGLADAEGLAARLNEAFGVELDAMAFFVEFPTLRELSQHLGEPAVEPEAPPSFEPEPQPAPKPVVTPEFELRGARPPRRFPAAPRTAHHPLSYEQEWHWSLEALMRGHATMLVLQFSLEVDGVLDTVLLEQVLSELVRRQESLRTRFVEVEGEVRQEVLPWIDPHFRQVDLRQEPADTRRALFEELAQDEQERSFDLTTGPLFRLVWVHSEEARGTLLFTVHHILADVHSALVFFRELAHLYTAWDEGRPAELPTLPRRYVDFAHWERSWFEEHLEQQRQIWLRRLSGRPMRLDLPYDRPPPPTPAWTAGHCRHQLPEALHQAVVNRAAELRVTPFTVYLGSLLLLLHTLTEEEPVHVGIPHQQRNFEGVEHLVGFFSTIVAIVAEVEQDLTLAEFLGRVHRVIQEAIHEPIPFAELVALLRREGQLDPGTPPLQVSCNYNRAASSSLIFSDLEGEPEAHPSAHQIFDLFLLIAEFGGQVEVRLKYRDELFDQATAEDLLQRYERILQAVTDGPQRLPGELFEQAELPRPRRLAIVANFTIEPVIEPLRHLAAECGVPAVVQAAPYDQVVQQLLTPDSTLRRVRRGLAIVLLRLEDWALDRERSHPPEWEAMHQRFSERVNLFLQALETALAAGGPSLVVVLCPDGPELSGDVRWQELATEQVVRLRAALQTSDNASLVTAEDIARRYPATAELESELYRDAHIPYTEAGYAGLALAIARHLFGLEAAPFKVLAVDCDNTLWRGVVGEDGWQGLVVDEQHRRLQAFLVEQQRQGVLICLCSKNEEADVLEVFEKREDMVLQTEHLVGHRINWEAKSANLVSLAEELNLGLDAFVFLDDNPVECAEVKSACPGVLVLRMPEDDEAVHTLLDHTWAFDRRRTSAEDRRRTELYRQNAQREKVRQHHTSMEDFLQQLELQVEIRRPAEQDVHKNQLLMKFFRL